MNYFNDKTIVTDVDGVLLDWISAFERHMRVDHGINPVNPDVVDMAPRYNMSRTEIDKYVRPFNTSEYIRHLNPLNDAVEYVLKLRHDHGFVFHVVTAIGTDTLVQQQREENLVAVFGDGVFDSYTYVDHGHSKFDSLLPYRDTRWPWIEDNPNHAMTGLGLGMIPYLMQPDYVRDTHHPAVNVVSTWREIHDAVTGSFQHQTNR